MEEFILRNWKPILSAFVLIAVVVLIFLVVKDYKAKQDIKSATAYAQVETVEDLEKALNDFGACSAANSARIKLAGILLSKNDFEKSSALLSEVMNDNNEDMYIRIKCAMDSGYILVKAGKTDDAFSRFDAVLSNTQATADQRSEAAYAKALIYFDKKEYDKA